MHDLSACLVNQLERWALALAPTMFKTIGYADSGAAGVCSSFRLHVLRRSPDDTCAEHVWPYSTGESVLCNVLLAFSDGDTLNVEYPRSPPCRRRRRGVHGSAAGRGDAAKGHRPDGRAGAAKKSDGARVQGAGGPVPAGRLAAGRVRALQADQRAG